MIKWKIVKRLAVTAVAGALLMLTLAYWWLNNLTHELAGTVMFTLVAWHITRNRAWLVNLLRGRYDARRRLVAVLHVALMVNMLLLFATSLAISQSVFAFLRVPDSVTVRDLHWVSAYWLVITVGIHLGLHWSRVMALLRSGLRVTGQSIVRTGALRVAALAAALFGAWSFAIMGVGTKLSWNYSLDFWDFSSAVAPFFAHWAGVVALAAIVTHYGLTLLARQATGRRAG